MTVTRGTSNTNARGSTLDRQRRREYLVRVYRADRDVHELVAEALAAGEPPSKMPRNWYIEGVPRGEGVPACRCYRCGILLTADTVTVDRIVPGCMGGTYRRDNIRPACEHCNTVTGAALASVPKKKARTP